ncbi:MAG: response regulator [Ignavibacteriota bacterium]|nr:response regulator [Ignavibacteriota bacterium]MBW7842156.1 response regulator [Ignavibacterium sp.]MCO6448992.1 response regulator [Ignavibacterium album]MCZ2268355.1 response regulator [Ignavibacteriales bacterium]HOJ08039.1 response regulator [Ignavibacteriaceae bacterium]
METVLFIEDDKALRENFGKILSLNNYYPILAETGEMGLRLAKKILPDLIICDIMLPDIDGYQILKELSQTKETQTIPFIFLTAKAEMEDLRKGMNLGADDYLTKPIKTKEVLQAIRLRLDKKIKVNEMAADIKQDENQQLSIEDSILISSDGKAHSVNLNEIICIISAGVYSNINIINNKVFLVRKLIKEWERILPEKCFIRVHRTAIINTNHIKSIEKSPNHTFRIFLKDFDRAIISSHKFSKRLREKLFQ